MQVRLGSWQQQVLSMLKSRGTVAFSEVRPKGKARHYEGSYLRSFRALANVPGVQFGAYGPRGGLALRWVG